MGLLGGIIKILRCPFYPIITGFLVGDYSFLVHQTKLKIAYYWGCKFRLIKSIGC